MSETKEYDDCKSETSEFELLDIESQTQTEEETCSETSEDIEVEYINTDMDDSVHSGEEIDELPLVSIQEEINGIESQQNFEEDTVPAAPQHIKYTSEDGVFKTALSSGRNDPREYTVLEVNYIPFISTKHNGKYQIIYNCHKTNGIPRVYIGDVSRGKHHGKGKLMYSPTEYKEGYFEHGDFVNGVHSKNGNYHRGNFHNGKLHSRHATIYTNGHIFHGTVVHGVPVIDSECSSTFDPDMVVNFLGYNGKITNSRIESNRDCSLLEGVLDVQLQEDCLINIFQMRVCIYSENIGKYGYTTTFPVIVTIRHLMINGKTMNSNRAEVQVTNEKNVLTICNYYENLISLFGVSKRFSVNNKNIEIKNICGVGTISIDDMNSWGTNKLVLWALITFPHIDASFAMNLKNYCITGYQFKRMNPLHYWSLIDYPCDLYKQAYICQIQEALGESADTCVEFYEHVMKNVPMAKDMLNFIHECKITQSVFEKLDSDMLNKWFNPIYIFQIRMAQK
jgi:hypothetical protein